MALETQGTAQPVTLEVKVKVQRRLGFSCQHLSTLCVMRRAQHEV